jgi:hypothetical protein
MPKANYGIDAPTVVRNLAIGAVACYIAAYFIGRGFLGASIRIHVRGSDDVVEQPVR